MPRGILGICGLILAAVSGLAQSFGVTHAATNVSPISAAEGLAPGSLASVIVAGLLQPRGPLAVTDTLTVRLRSAGGSDLEMSQLPSQSAPGSLPTLLVLVPKSAPIGQAQIVVVSQVTGREFTGNIWISASNFRAFNRDQSGFGPALAQVTRERVELTGLTTPVRAGDWVTLWGTGLGNAEGPVWVNAGGQLVQAAYAGPAAGFPGLEQVNFQVSANTPKDCYVPITVQASPALDQPALVNATLAVADSGSCNHRLGLTLEQMRILDSGGSVLSPTASVESRLGLASFSPLSYARREEIYVPFGTTGQLGIARLTGLWSDEAPGCQLGLFFASVLIRSLASNADLEVTGPGDFRQRLSGGYYVTPNSSMRYSLDGVPPSIFVPGEWKLIATGGLPNPFTTTLRVPPPLRWDRSSLTDISRAKDLTLRWDPSGYTQREWMAGAILVNNVGVLCRVPATTGSMTIPASFLAAVPQVGSRSAEATLQLSPSSRELSSFDVPWNGTPPGRGLATFVYMETLQVDLP